MKIAVPTRQSVPAAVLLAVLLTGSLAVLPSALGHSEEPPQDAGVQVRVFAPVTPSVFTGDLRRLPQALAWTAGSPIMEIPRRHTVRAELGHAPEPRGFGLDPLVGLQARTPTSGAGVFSSSSLNLPGQGYSGVTPPDPVGDVGQNFYIQMINGSGGATITVYNKTDGSLAAGPITLDSLAGSGSCASGKGDPVVLFDQLAERWMLSEFSSSGNTLCVYVSQTSDPILGGWYSYAFALAEFPDYPKYAIWPDAYYVSTNESSPRVYAFDRANMLQGSSTSYQGFTASALSGFSFQALTPSDVDGGSTPPIGSPNYFMRHRDTEAHGPGGFPTTDQLEIWEFDVDWAIPGNSTFSLSNTITIAEFDSDLCGFFTLSCFPQPGGGAGLDSLREVIMWRLAYRNFGTYEILVGNFVTDLTGTDVGAIRWFELRKSLGGGAWALHQEGTFAPGGPPLNNWMGSAAMDGAGNIGMGYNFVDSTTYASLGYTGRLSTDVPGVMTAGALSVVSGGGTTGGSYPYRYGDYNSLNLDPVDDCTFWFTGEYNPTTLWGTRISTFKFGSCAKFQIFIGEEDTASEGAPPVDRERSR